MTPKSDACDEVSIAFSGTRPFWSWEGIQGWLSNGRIGFTELVAESYYQQLQRNIDFVIKKITKLDCYKQRMHKSSPPVIVSIGHSLGGGLAQLAALANTAPSKIDPSPRIDKVFAFDPSADTGGDLVNHETLETNGKELSVDRIMHSGEALSGTHEDARLYTRARETVYDTTYEFFPPWNQICQPMVRNVVYFSYTKGSGKELHEIVPLTAALIQAGYPRDLSEEEKPSIPRAQIPRPTKLLSGKLCPTRYERTHPEERYQEAYPPPPPETLVSELGPRPVLTSPAPTQPPNLGLLQALFAPAYAQAADTSVRRALHAPASRTQLADWGQRQPLFSPEAASVADIGARRGGFHTAAPQTKVAVQDQRQALSAPPTTQVADLGARLTPARHRIGHSENVQRVAIGTSNNVKARRVATASSDPSNSKSAIPSAL